MNRHSFGFETKWELIDPEGQIIQKSQQSAFEEPVCDGKITYQILNQRKEVVYENEKPMESFTADFLTAFVDGYRIAKRNESFVYLPNMLGAKYSPTYVQQVGLISPFDTYSTTDWTTSSLDSVSSGIVLDSLTSLTNVIRAVFHVERSITTGAGTIKEIGLYSTRANIVSGNAEVKKIGMIARESFQIGQVFNVGVSVKLTWTIDFYKNSNRSLTMNWIKNFLQEIAGSNYTDFTLLDGTQATGSSNAVQTFTKEQNCRGTLGDDDKGIIIGTSNVPVDEQQYTLGARVLHGTNSGQIEYSAMSETSDISIIYPTLGKAKIVYYRDFQNNSGAAITIREAGLVAKTTKTTEGVGTAGSYLLARWLTQDVEIPNNYTFRIYFQPIITATAEDHSAIDSSQIILVTDEMRAAHPSLSRISMIQKTVQQNKTWVQAKKYAASLSLGGYSDWRLPALAYSIQPNPPDTFDYELWFIKQIYDSELSNNLNFSTWANDERRYDFGGNITYDFSFDGSWLKTNQYQCFCVR